MVHSELEPEVADVVADDDMMSVAAEAAANGRLLLPFKIQAKDDRIGQELHQTKLRIAVIRRRQGERRRDQRATLPDAIAMIVVLMPGSSLWVRLGSLVSFSRDVRYDVILLPLQTMTPKLLLNAAE